MNIAAVKKIFPYALIVFLGALGFALPFPVLPAMFISAEASILPATFSTATKSIFLGFALAAYPTGQLIGSPLLGFLSDRIGRKKVILSSLLFTAFGYAITAMATSHHVVYGILGGLFLCGLSEGNVGIAQAVIADISEKTLEKTKNANKVLGFGSISLLVSTAFVIGPLLGGGFVDPSKGFSFATPFWIATMLFCIAFCIVWNFAKETRIEREGKDRCKILFFQKIKQNCSDPLLKRLYGASFCLYFGAFTFWNCFPMYLERTFAFSSQKLSYAVAYQAFFFAIGILVFIKRVAKKIAPRNVIILSGIALSCMLIIVTIPSSPVGIIWTNPFLGIVLSVLVTNISVVISNTTTGLNQGQAMGFLQSMNSFAALLVGLCSGIFLTIATTLPFIVGSIMALVGAFIMWDARRFLLSNTD